jgi:hypothetical protein
VKTPFLGPSYVAQTLNLADQQTINLYPEIVETKTGKDVGAFYLCPGLDFIISVGLGPIQAFTVMQGVLYVVSGNSLYSVDQDYLVSQLGGLMTPGAYVYEVISNAAQTTNQVQRKPGFSIVNLPFNLVTISPITITNNGFQVVVFVGASVAQQDGYCVVNQPGTYLVWQSDLLDATNWQALNFASASGDPDDIIAIAQIHRELFIIQERATEIWINAGTAGFVFSRLEGVYIELGTVAPLSVVQVGETLMMLSRNHEGQNAVVQITGYNPRNVTTQGLIYEFSGYSKTSDAIAYSYQQAGHTFYVISFPSADKTWVYDVTSSAFAGVPMWHRRASFANGTFSRHHAQVGIPFNNNIIVGDKSNGNLYKFNTEALTDNGVPRKWLRSWRALQRPSEQPVRFSSLRIDMQTGVGVPDGTDPLVVLRWSDDGGHNWSNEMIAHAGPPGATAQRVKFNRLGSTRRNSGLDRIFELSSTDTFPAKLIGAELE